MTASRIRVGVSRYRFLLSVVVLIAPMVVVVSVLRAGWAGDWARVHPERTVGPWTVRLAEVHAEPPYRMHDGRRLKDYGAELCDECANDIRAAFLAVRGASPTLEDPGWPLHGSTHHLEAHVEFPSLLQGDERLWLTVEGWDGAVHQISWPLDQVGAGDDLQVKGFSAAPDRYKLLALHGGPRLATMDRHFPCNVRGTHAKDRTRFCRLRHSGVHHARRRPGVGGWPGGLPR